MRLIQTMMTAITRIVATVKDVIVEDDENHIKRVV